MKKFAKTLSLMTALIMLLAVLGACQQPEQTQDGGQASDQPQSAGNRLDAIKERGYLTVCMEPSFAPMQFIDPSLEGDAQYIGSDVEFAKYIAEKLGVECRIVPLEFAAVLAGISDGKFDLAISALGYTPARAEAMEMSDGYFFPRDDKGHGLLVRTDDLQSITGPDSTNGKVLVVQSGSLQEMFVTEQIDIKALKELKYVSATPDAFLMVQEGKADVCAVSIPMAELYIESNPDCGLALVPNFQFTQTEETAGTRIALPKGETALLDFINEVVAEIRENGMYEKWYDEFVEYARNIGL